MFFAFLTLIVGLSISGTAAYFSITGLGQLFAASFWGVVLMGFVIESGKIISATWLHKNWHNPLVSTLHKSYLMLAIIITMCITSLGIFSYLSAAHLNQEAPVIEQLTAERTVQKQIDTLQADLNNLQKNLDQVNELSKTSNNPSLDAQRTRILRQMDKDRNQINDLDNQMSKLKQQTSQVTLKLGPAQYLGQILFGDGDENTDKAVEIFIALLMTVFDPLALMLILSANISFQTIAGKQPTPQSKKPQKTPEIIEEKHEVKKEEIKKLPEPTQRNWWFN